MRFEANWITFVEVMKRSLQKSIEIKSRKFSNGIIIRILFYINI